MVHVSRINHEMNMVISDSLNVLTRMSVAFVFIHLIYTEPQKKRRNKLQNHRHLF